MYKRQNQVHAGPRFVGARGIGLVAAITENRVGGNYSTRNSGIDYYNEIKAASPYPCRRQFCRLACSSSHEAKSTPMKMVPGWKVLPTVT